MIMDLKEIVKRQKDFDRQHGWVWDVEDEREFVERLKYLAIAINGEAGEFANIIKKSVRENFPDGKMPDEQRLQDIKEELVDIFIYTIIASTALRMDLEEEYLKKVKKLEERFRRFEK